MLREIGQAVQGARRGVDVRGGKRKGAGRKPAPEIGGVMDDLFVTSEAAKRFVRVWYDDSRRFPWVLSWGEDHEVASFRTREAAVRRGNDLQVMCDVFHDWMFG
jgi:hypothetical protein